jgi:hypothetical protein
MKIPLILASVLCMPVSYGMYFYLDGHTPKCFLEALPKEVTVIGKATLIPCHLPVSNFSS